VQRMEGVDAGYLYMETPTMHMHTLKISLVEPAESFDPAYFTEVVLERLKDLPAFGRRALKVPFGLNHPLWIADRPIDPSQHVFVHRVPEPGGMAGLEDLIGEIAGRPLDQSLPLWEVHVTEPTPSLGGGGKRVAVVAKMHHALADGGAANALLGVVTDAVREEIGVPAPQVLEPTPSRLAQVRMALLDALGQVLSLPGLLYTTGRGIAGVLKLRRGSSVRVPRPILDAPRTPFNAALTARRNFATASLPLDEVRAVAKAHGVTVNDVVLALVSGTLRGWLADNGEQPDRSLLAGVPVGTDTAGTSPQRLGGNRVSNLFTTLATDVDDPADRLRLISATTRESKLVQQTLGPDLLREWVQFTPPVPMSLAMRGYSAGRLASHHNPPFNVVVSNVRGPGKVVTVANARLVDLFSVGPILEGIGLNVTAWSYAGRLNFSLLGCPDLVADLRPIAARLAPALEELRRASSTPAHA
jgi:diacylglycerol O-acyltransferase